MDLQVLIDDCASRPGAVLEFPFGPSPACFKNTVLLDLGLEPSEVLALVDHAFASVPPVRPHTSPVPGR